MYGAILGDMIGSPFEFDRGKKTKEFPLFAKHSTYTDDSVMTIAVGDAFLDAQPNAADDWTMQRLVSSMQYWGRKHPHAGYGGRFRWWLRSDDPRPYSSYGNGSAMRVSAVAWLYHDIESVRKAAMMSAVVTHNHPEGIKGAEATAAAIFLARTGHSKAEIKEYVEQNFQYDLSRSCDEIRPSYRHVESCQETVPEAITAFLEGEDFEDVIQDYVFTDGSAEKSIERRFVEDLDAAQEVCVYAKLPKGFHIPTPVGNYSPDWAIAFYEGTVKHIFFVAETKGTMDSMNLRPIEQAKISCAKKLFNEISTSNVKYHDVDSYQNLLNIMASL